VRRVRCAERLVRSRPLRHGKLTGHPRRAPLRPSRTLLQLRACATCWRRERRHRRGLQAWVGAWVGAWAVLSAVQRCARVAQRAARRPRNKCRRATHQPGRRAAPMPRRQPAPFSASSCTRDLRAKSRSRPVDSALARKFERARASATNSLRPLDAGKRKMAEPAADRLTRLVELFEDILAMKGDPRLVSCVGASLRAPLRLRPPDESAATRVPAPLQTPEWKALSKQDKHAMVQALQA